MESISGTNPTTARIALERPQKPESAQSQGREGLSDGFLGQPGSVTSGRDVRFHVSFRQETGDLVFEVRDHRTGEMIRQFPPEALLEAGQQLADLRGFLLDELA